MKTGNGAIALVGSGEYLPVMQELETKLLHSGVSRGKKNTYIQIPTAAAKESANRLQWWKERGQAQADRIGCECIFLPIFNREDAFNDEYIAQVKDAGLIYFSGGDPGYLADVFRDTPLWDSIVAEWEGGASLAGCSAGAMAFGSKIVGIRRSTIHLGLNLLPYIEVIPHYDKFLGWLPEQITAAIVRPDADTVLIGIDEDTALVHVNSWKRFGAGQIHILRGEFNFTAD